jgi:hypothetical protein
MKIIISLIVIVSACFGVFFWSVNYFCLAEEFKDFKKTVEYRFKSDQIYKTNERIWQLEERVKKSPSDETAAKELKRLDVEKKQYEQELQELGKKK